MKNSDSNILSHWFRAFEAEGEYMGIKYGMALGESNEAVMNTIEWVDISHFDFDGIGAFGFLLRKHYGASNIVMPQMKSPLDSSVLRSFSRGVVDSLSMRQSFKVKFRNLRESRFQNTGKHRPTLLELTDLKPEILIFDEEQISRAAKLRQVSVNSMFLQKIIEVSGTYLGAPSAVQSWMIPVNMRGGHHWRLAKSEDTANQVSYISVHGNGETTMIEIQNKVEIAIARGLHWFIWHSTIIGAHLPAILIRKLVRHKNVPGPNWLGAFSNLGKWKPLSKPLDSSVWFFCPPIAQSQPIGIGCCSWNGKTTLSLQIHPTIANSAAISRDFMKDLGQKIQSLLE